MNDPTRRKTIAGRTCSALVACALLALLHVPGASAGPYIESASKTHARAGEPVQLRAGAGLRLPEPLPLYLVPIAKAPLPYACRRNALCRPRVAKPPKGGAYHRIGELSTRRTREVTITFRVPSLAPGRYVYVFYCGACQRGQGGSLIAWLPRPTLTVTA